VLTASGPIDISFALGLARHEADAPVLQIQQSLSAIGSAREAGKSLEWYRGHDPQIRRQLSMISDLRHAMEQGRLRLDYQPKLSLKTNRIADAEALIRWFDEAGNKISPDDFIPLAEETGMISEITLYALRAAAAQLAHWAREGVAIRVAVNVSAIDLAGPAFAADVERILAASGVPASQLTIEVTESALLRSPDKAIATLNALRSSGIRLSVDDYGTGQSTLSYLKRLPVHELKIDRSFISEIATNPSDEIMVRSTINLAHELGLEVVAEGIEDEASLNVLRKLGCDYAQGYFISRPLEPANFMAKVLAVGDAAKAA
jgi:EAL domain-containing protein (putative c-di-GMP-specific phosphodiesterase class I)